MAQEIATITQIPGIYAGHSTNAEAGTGCTVIICPAGATCGVDVRGGAPATRETDLLRPEETVGEIHAVVLSGGSAYGLAASCGVAEELERRGIGLDVGVGLVPIVTGACLFDLDVGDSTVRPTAADGADAVKAALDSPNVALERGNAGAGTGATLGRTAGPRRRMKSGLGEAVACSGSLVCGAVAAVNALGDVFDPRTGTAVAGVLDEDGSLLAESEQIMRSQQASMPFSRTNTTISCVVTNAKLTKAQATKVAQMCADAYAHTIRPTHTTNDGDIIFVMATGKVGSTVDTVAALATYAMEHAIVDGVRSARSAYGFKAACDL